MDAPHSSHPAQAQTAGGSARTSLAAAAADPAIAEAFLEFQRNVNASILPRCAPRKLGTSGWVLVALASLGFGGGLFLSTISFETPETPISVAGTRAPELIYTRPTSEATVPFAAPAFALASAEPGVQPAEDSSNPNRADDVDETNGGGAENAPLVVATSPLPDATPLFETAVRLGVASTSSGSAPAGAATQVGYAAVELPTAVPELSPGPIVAAASALLLAARHLRRRRRF